MSAQNPNPIAKRSGTAVCLRGLPPLLAGILVAAVLVPTSTALGRDESGMYDVLLGRSPAAAYHAAMPVDLAPVERKRRPRPGRVTVRASAERRELTASLTSSDWLAAILADETLRPRDIVVFPDGPKVFVGSGFGPPWSTSDFEDVATSRADNRSREAIRSVVGTRGGLEFAAFDARKSPLQVAISDRQAGKN